MALSELAAWSALALSIILGVLLFAQGSRLARLERQFKSLMRGAGATTLTMSLGDLVADHGEQLETMRSGLTELTTHVTSLDRQLLGSVQHVGLVRFNPFGDTGGDQSFALALLDKSGDGVVVSSLHTRTMTRFYAKPVKGGTSALSLSDEESLAVQQALGT